jgi:serine/threonine-protein kinase
MGAKPDRTTVVDPRVGRVLQGRYKILAPIGEGAMGTVYRAERLTLGRPVAIKFLLAQLANEPLLVKRFEVEALVMSSLSHPNCVSVIDFGVDQSPYLVMDLVSGKSLRAVIDEGPIPVPRALRIARQILSALSHAHGHGIIHRDIKPENIVVEKVAGIEDHIRVLDFGVAKVVGSQLKLTMGMMLGTPNYMAPELTREGAFDERVDLYATGIVLFEMLTGRAPFDAPDLHEVLLRMLTMPSPRLREVSPGAGFSAELERVVLQSMARDPFERFPSASAMGAALDALRDGEAPPRSPTIPRLPAGGVSARIRALATRIGRSRRRSIAVAFSVGLALSIVAAALAVPTGAPPRKEAVTVTASVPDPVPVATVSGAAAQSDQDEREQAIKRLLELRRSEPRNAEHPVALARLYFEKRWWSAGLDAARGGLRIDPALRRDPLLIKQIIRALQSDKAGDEAAVCLLEMGPAARPLLRDAAANDPSPRVRARAADILRSSERAPLFGFGRR